jgi:CSLREA domain-containing protein
MARTALCLASGCLALIAFASVPKLQSVAANITTPSDPSFESQPFTPTGSTIVVNTTADVDNNSDGLCTLREAIGAANTDVASGATAGEARRATAQT